MNFKSIENQDIVNLENCDSEPIHIPGSIQPHGFLLATDADERVRFCSNNLEEFGLTPSGTLNKKLSEIFSSSSYNSLREYMQQSSWDDGRPHTLQHEDRSYNLLVHASGPYLILEFEPLPGSGPDLRDMYVQTRNFTRIVSQSSGLQPLCQAIAEEIRAVAGYDRVMVYKFDERYNGEIFAEAKADHLESFLGLHYPHTDIPIQARKLYMTNLLRMIVDVDYRPVPIITANLQAAHHDLDLGRSMLRSVSPIHIEYLKNMGVQATLTISLLQDNKLWGLIACHHYSARNIPYHTRLSALLQGHFLTSQIRVQEAAEDYRLKRHLDGCLQSFLKLLGQTADRDTHEIVGPELGCITRSNGVCLVEGSAVYSYGDVPSDEDIRQLNALMHERGADMISCNNVQQEFGIAISGNVAGFLYYKIDAGNSVFWFKNELTKEIHWAGEPAKAIVKNEKGLSPRKSFAVWKEVVTGYSSPWMPAEIDVAFQCVYAIQKFISHNRSRKTEMAQRKLLAQLRAANEELENLNWISTHDLREPLRKIGVFASLLQDKDKYKFDEAAHHVIARLTSSARRMQLLIDDLIAYSQAKSASGVFVPASLNELLDNALADLEPENTPSPQIQKDRLPEVLCMPEMIQQLFARLIHNSIRFTQPGTSARIDVSYEQVTEEGQRFHRISFRDYGIGFDNQYRDLIFQIFQRLDGSPGPKGSGIGLAICRKIAELHGGRISANGTPGEGATFTILLPFQPQEAKH